MASPGRRQPLRSKTQSKRALSDDDKINPPYKRSRPEPFNRQAHRDQSNLSPPGCVLDGQGPLQPSSAQ